MAKLTYRRIPNALQSYAEFQGNSMRGTTTVPMTTVTGYDGRLMEVADMGIMPRLRQPEFWREVRDALYVVYSRETPIAWIKADGTMRCPDIKYSVTTTRQQNLCRAWLESTSYALAS